MRTLGVGLDAVGVIGVKLTQARVGGTESVVPVVALICVRVGSLSNLVRVGCTVVITVSIQGIGVVISDLMTVIDAVSIRVRVSWVGMMLVDLCPVIQSITVRIGIVRISAELHLLGVGQPVAVAVQSDLTFVAACSP